MEEYINHSIDKKITFYQKNIIAPIKPTTNKAIIVFFVYKDIVDNDTKKTLYLFIKTNLKFNKETTIYIFTNQDLNVSEKDCNRLKITHLKYLDEKTMTNRVIFNYIIINKFNIYEKIIFFDSDLIPLDYYQFEDDFDIGLTYNQNYLAENKFAINAGFLIINYRDIDKVNNFNRAYLDSYKSILKNEKIIMTHFNLEKLPSEWYGDQLVFHFMKLNFPKDEFKTYEDIEYQKNIIRYYNEFKYNYLAIELKRYIKNKYENFSLDEYINLCRNHDTKFLHLKGIRKLLAQEIEKYLI